MVNKAILVGINYLNDSKHRLNSPINDITIVKHFLIHYCNYQEEDILVLSDSPKEKENASFFNIVKHIKLLGKEMTSQDFLFMYFSGHGGSIVDGSGDEADRKDEIFLPQDWQISYISDDLFNSLLKSFKCKIFLMFDCCNSGTMCDLKYSYNVKDFMSTDYLRYDNKDSADIICLSSCGENSKSYEKYITENMINSDKNKFYGEFTIFFLHMLKAYLEENLTFDNFTYNDMINLMNYYVYPLDESKDFTISQKIMHRAIYNKNLKPLVGLSFKDSKDSKFFKSRSEEDTERFEREGAINTLKRKTNSSLSYKLLRQNRKIEFLERKNKTLVDRNNKLLSIVTSMNKNFNVIVN